MNTSRQTWLLLPTLLVASLSLPGSISARKVASSYVEFDIPDGWECKQDGQHWEFQDTNPELRKVSILIMAAKFRGPNDSIRAYFQRLKKLKRTVRDLQGRPFKSKLERVRIVKINKHKWVDAVHRNSEVPLYTTRYLATIKGDIGVVLTYSIHSQYYKKLAGGLDVIARTLKVIYKKK